MRVALLLVLLSTAARAAPVDVTFELKARIRSFSVDADLWAGARVTFDTTEDAGRTKFRLTRVGEAPWKFYWVSPAVGSAEVKFATEATLPEGTWPARAAVEKDTDARGRAKHAEWTKTWKGQRPFDQAFTFFVIGPPAGRFAFEESATGQVSGVTNRLTHKWLPTGFPDWVAGKPTDGYGFWAADPQPPAWEPHAWHAFDKALRLLACDVVQGGDAWTADCPALAGARDVVETLAPKTKGRLAVEIPKTLAFKRTGKDLVGTAAGASRKLTIAPENGQIVADQLALDLTNDGAEIHLKIGWAR